MKYFLAILGAITVFSLYNLTVATDYSDIISNYFEPIIIGSAALAALLLIILISQLWRIHNEARKKIFGAHLSQRLVKAFTIVAFVPSLVLFFISIQFIVYNINSWFNNDTAQALDRSLYLSQQILDRFLQTTQAQNDILAQSIQVQNSGYLVTDTFQQVNKRAFAQVILYEKNSDNTLTPIARIDYLPNLSLVKKNEWPTQNEATFVHLDSELYTQIWTKIQMNDHPYWLLTRQKVPDDIATDAALIERARARHAELHFSKFGLQSFFIFTLMIAALLSLLWALLIAIYFARRFVVPLNSLSEVTLSISQGDFSRRASMHQHDELGELSKRFNHMTTEIQKLYSQQESARKYLELILQNLSTGVMTLNAAGCLKTFNRSAEQILNIQLESLVGHNLTHWSGVGARIHMIKRFISELLLVDNTKLLEFEYLGDVRLQKLLGKSIRISDGDNILIFDDITDLLSAQKEAAWGEVAQRLAHEIRNPLTPIQLSAERLEQKLSNKLDEHDAQLLSRYTGTIVKQVDALKEMLTSFRNYSRANRLKFERISLNDIILNILVLYENITECTFHTNLTTEQINIHADLSALRQILLNLYKNAYEAALESSSPEVWISTQRENNHVSMTVRNNGKSFSPTILRHLFEPYMTDKKDGTGLGLSVVKRLVDAHQGIIEANNTDDGAQVKITFPIMEN